MLGHIILKREMKEKKNSLKGTSGRYLPTPWILNEKNIKNRNKIKEEKKEEAIEIQSFNQIKFNQINQIKIKIPSNQKKKKEKYERSF